MSHLSEQELIDYAEISSAFNADQATCRYPKVHAHLEECRRCRFLVGFQVAVYDTTASWLRLGNTNRIYFYPD